MQRIPEMETLGHGGGVAAGLLEKLPSMSKSCLHKVFLRLSSCVVRGAKVRMRFPKDSVRRFEDNLRHDLGRISFPFEPLP